MATNPAIKPRRGTSTPGVGAILQNELAIDTTNKRIFIGAADGSGTLIGSAPGGSDTQVQFNDSGVMGGDSGLTFNKTTDSLTVTGDLAVNGSDITTTGTGTATLFNTNALTVNMGGAATAITIGDATTATTTIRGGTLVGNVATQNVFNTTATTVNAYGAATTAILGYNSTSSSATSISTGATGPGNTKTLNLGTGAAAGSTTNVNIGSSQGGTTTINSGTVVGSAGTQALFNTTATTMNFAGAATAITMGSTSGTTTIRNPNLLISNSTTTGTVMTSGAAVLALQTGGASVDGTNASIQISPTGDGLGEVSIEGGNLRLGTRILVGPTNAPVGIIFEGLTSDGNEIFLTSVDPTADQTITLPNATGTVALVAGSDTQVMFNDGGSALGGDSGLTYNKTTDSLTVTGDLAVNGSDITTSGSGTATLFNTNALTVNMGGAATTLTMGATSGTASIRNATLTLGNTTSAINTNSGTANNLTLSPFGKVTVSPTSSSVTGGSRPSLVIENSDQAAGVVEISGGDLYLGRKTVNDVAYTPVGIIFEGATNDTSETTLTVADPTADRTITLPDATGTVALLGTGSTTDGRLPYYDTTTKTFLGTTYLSYDDATNILTLNCAEIITGSAITTTNSTVSLLNATATTINFGGAATTFNIGGAASATINLGKTDGTTTVDMNSNVLREVELRSYFETKGTSTYTGGMNQDLAVDLSTGNVFVYTTTGSISTFTVNSIPSKSGISVGFTVVITCGNALYSVNFDSFTSGSIVWAGGTPPTATNTVNRTDIVSYVTYDGGTTWYGMTGGLNFS